MKVHIPSSAVFEFGRWFQYALGFAVCSLFIFIGTMAWLAYSWVVS